MISGRHTIMLAHRGQAVAGKASSWRPHDLARLEHARASQQTAARDQLMASQQSSEGKG